MLSRVETSSSLSLVAVMCDLPYSPALLLKSSFDASITDSDEFRKACQWGYDAYFEDMYVTGESETALVFVAKCFTWVEIVEFVTQMRLVKMLLGTSSRVIGVPGLVFGSLLWH